MDTLTLQSADKHFVALMSIKEEVEFFNETYEFDDEILTMLLKAQFESYKDSTLFESFKHEVTAIEYSMFSQGLEWVQFCVRNRLKELKLVEQGLDDNGYLFVSVLSSEMLLLGNKEEVLRFRKKMFNEELNDTSKVSVNKHEPDCLGIQAQLGDSLSKDSRTPRPISPY